MVGFCPRTARRAFPVAPSICLRADPYFTQWRYFDWYVGHAWAGGIFPIPEGRNQESTSESINAWYAIQLYGEA